MQMWNCVDGALIFFTQAQSTGTAPYVYTYPAGTRPRTPTLLAGRAFAYDANGNLTNDQAKQLTWDSANRLASVSRGGKTTSFAYGPDG
jgi:hypothetical protein